jgi:hypothetical protein
MPAAIQFDGLFRPSPRMNVVPGAWYLGFHCSACAKPIAVLDDPTGSGIVEIGGAGEFEVQCPSCGQTRTYPARTMAVWQATTGSPSGLD